ncbi:MAG TPA: aspartyl protease family protein [Flavobacterium sp.]|uniref:retropepsin-like aspartic protease n=1 Tax=Flavobacterium sp. TaxID=239 RepID=UPI002F400610
MNKIALFLFLLIYGLPVCAQDGFQFKSETNKVSIPFQLINNLVFIPLKVNGIELTFLLDSGVEETVLFSLEDKKEVSLKNVEKISLRGLGSEEAVEGLKSEGNLLEIKGMESRKHLLYIILDQNFNMSSHVGIPVNGIIGYSFFKNNLVEINYDKKRVLFYKDIKKNKKRIEKKYDKIPISIERGKPYITTTVVIDSVIIPAKLLVDVGNSDAIWLFQNGAKNVNIPKKNFEDYLGRGFSGDVEGKRARISEFIISEFKFSNPIAAFPDSSSLKHVKMVTDRLGSVGGEILKRFSVVFDYSNKNMFLKKNSSFYAPFHYNKSGIEIRHSGVQWVQETVHLQTIPIVVDHVIPRGDKTASDFKYKFQLKPVYEIANLRKNSPGKNSGLQVGDIIKTVNGKQAYKYSLQELNSLLRSEDEKWVTMEVERKNQILKFGFLLKDIL